MARDFKNIKAWQHADDLAVSAYSKTRFFPKEELYGITSQLRRAVVSVPTNIAEGASREHKKEYLNFLYIARGSLAETEYLLHLANRLKYLQDDDYKKLEDIGEETAKTLQGLIIRFKKKSNNRSNV
jgi:four helix bundle protein